MSASHVEYLAHHMLLLAAPAFLPAVVVVAVILYVALRDRRDGQTDETSAEDDIPAEKRD
ncbi:hypothetical protein [Mycobacterium sherrisii]|uniref:Uncharacterized protein n=1 Tax=Mycobacterium sherrisii TaxID=243061 RepID=A0A1E3T3H6_9MYCO|nr:hypothetical protein [Mycobacterium sherrisii]MCV7030400.1 hypothetical protein [Mycobacterium sherrisii]MEC4763829.1 hypothetical protein [Mycobacterium sherrisii]ODR08453.1 hypothetical protein BHQ21_06525 [Mycobacterium sherrisii]ORW75337.1 hypothetical protein AWC25_14165 [Mycobacterium sherrisii]